MAESLAERGRALQRGMGAALVAVGEAWAQACQDEAPEKEGVLKGSIRFVPDSETRGHLEFVFYGEIQAAGVPGQSMRGWSGQMVRMPPLSQMPKDVRRRARYAARVGHTVQHPNAWYVRGWESERVQQVIRDWAQYAISAG